MLFERSSLGDEHDDDDDDLKDLLRSLRKRKKDSGSNNNNNNDIEDDIKSPKQTKRRPRVEIEYEQERGKSSH